MTLKNRSNKTARIKDVAELDPETLGESTAPSFTFKYIDLSSVKGGRIGEHVELMTFAAAPGRARKLVKDGDILLGMVRPYLKPFAKVQSAFDGHVASTGFAVIRAKTDVTDPEYLYQTIWSDGISKQIHQMVTGSNYPALSVGDVRDLKVPLPPLAEQRKIAEILRTWDEAIETAEAELKAKQERKRWLAAKVFSIYALESVDCKLSDLVDRLTKAADDPNKYEVLSISAGKGFELQREKYSRVIAGKQIAKYVLLRRGDFSYNKGNSLRYPVGCVYQLEHSEGLVPNVFCSFRIKGERCDAGYVRHYFSLGMHNAEVMKRVNMGVRNNGLLNITPEQFFGITFKIPSLGAQLKIAEILNHHDEDEMVLTRHIELMRAQKRGLMQKLLTGEVRVAA